MKKLYKASLLLSIGAISLQPVKTAAQYCTPTVNTSGLYLGYISFDASLGFTGGAAYNNGSSGYTQTVASSSGTLHRYFGAGMFYGISNPFSVATNFTFATYVDWNNDGDFNDANEVSYPISGSTPAGTTTTFYQITPPLATPAGDYRVRLIVSQNSTGTPPACGSFTGEVQDYKITVAANVAPVLKPGVTPVLNSLINTQTASTGFSINELVGSAEPADTLIKDADDLSAGFGSKVPRGIAIYGQTATNGTWQYKIGTGAWTDFGTLSTTNALLLMADGGFSSYQPGTRIRFVPNGTGTPSISFKAWDATTGTNGGYASVVTTGGSTAFSTGNQTTSLSVTTNSGYNSSVYFAAANNVIYNSPMNRTTKAIANPEPLLNGSGSYTGQDIDVDPVSNKLFWICPTFDTIFASGTNGAAPTAIVSGLNYSTGLTIGNGKLYYSAFNSDFSALQVYKANTDGSNATIIYTSSAMSDSKDIEFYNNKIYFQYGDVSTPSPVYHIGSIDTTGAGFATLYTAAANTYFQGLEVASDTIYWSEGNSTIKKRAISGGNITTLVTAPGRSMGDMVVDPVTSTIYFIDNDANSNDRYTNIKRMATTGGASTTVNTVTNMVASLAFDNSTTTPLAIELLDFKVDYKPSSTSALLTWETASEQSNTSFILERSTDAKSFKAIATIKGNVGATKENSYKYNDNLAEVDGNVFYYRLQQVQDNGQSSYSKTVVITRDALASATKLWPNPGNGNFNIHLGSLPSKAVTAIVYGSDGRQVKSIAIKSQDAILDLSAQQSGVYLLQLNMGDGNQKQFTLLKQ